MRKERSKKLVKGYSHNLMKAFFFFSISVILCSCGQDTTNEISSDDIYFDDGYNQNMDKNLPIITFEEVDFNFGIIIEGEKVGHTYNFTNTGKSDLIIADVRPACGCTSSKEYTREPIAPGEKGKIEVEFDSHQRPGDTKKSITVITNSQPNKTILYLLGEVMGSEKIENSESTIE